MRETELRVTLYLSRISLASGPLESWRRRTYFFASTEPTFGFWVARASHSMHGGHPHWVNTRVTSFFSFLALSGAGSMSDLAGSASAGPATRAAVRSDSGVNRTETSLV